MLSASRMLKKIQSVFGLKSNHSFTHLLPLNNSHLHYHNHWQILWLLFSVKRLSLSKSRYPPNCTADPHLLILISHMLPNYFRILLRSLLLKSLNSFIQCQISHLSSTTSPTSLLKSCADTFSLLISHLANLSFSQATCPTKFKLALISPLLKKPGLSKSDPSNFRPISNLNLIGKILERLALARLFPHVSVSPSFSPF